MKRPSVLLLAAALALPLAATPLAAATRAAQAPNEFKLLAKPHVAMLCALHMANLAIEAQRDPTGPADEAVDHSGRFFTLALAWLPDSQGVPMEVQTHLAHFVIETPQKELMRHAGYCATEASERLRRVSPAERAEASARGMQQAAKVAREIAAGG